MSASRYFNEMGEPLMTAEQARTEAYLDEQYWDQYYSSPEYQDAQMARYEELVEDACNQQLVSDCPSCGKYECEKPIVYNRRTKSLEHD